MWLKYNRSLFLVYVIVPNGCWSQQAAFLYALIWKLKLLPFCVFSVVLISPAFNQ